MPRLVHEQISFIVRGAVFAVYKTLGCSFKESIYHNALIDELIKRNLKAEKEKRISVTYNGKLVGTYIPDIVVNDIIILELKAKPFLTKGDKEQFWHYLKGSFYKLGFLINFGKPGGVEIQRWVYDTARIR